MNNDPRMDVRSSVLQSVGILVHCDYIEYD